MKKIAVLTLFLLSISKISYGQSIDSVYCYIQLQDLWDLDLNKATVKADFYLTIEFKNQLNKEINLLNGTIIRIDTLINSDSINVLSLRILAELRTKFEYNRFPLDDQKIEIEIEPYQYLNQMVLFSNPEQNIIVDTIHMNGWEVSEINFLQKTNNYKAVEAKKIIEYQYSAVYFEIPIIRQNKISYFIKTFLPCLVSILILYIGFILHANQIDLRINLAVGSLFVLISNFIVTQRYLPDVSVFTIIEKINIGSLFIVFITILFFTYSYKFKDRFTHNQWTKANRLYILLTTFLFSLMLIILLY